MAIQNVLTPAPRMPRAVTYRNVEDFDHPWVPSPATPHQPHGAILATSPPIRRKRSMQTVKIAYSPPKLSSPSRLLRLLGPLRRRTRRKAQFEIPLLDPEDLECRISPVHASEWKAYGYYARPRVNGVIVDNRSIHDDEPDPEYAFEPAVLFDSLRSPRGQTQLPDRWISGYKHPSLPPKPSRWKVPDEQAALPFPWECQINPFLAHPQTHEEPSPIHWDIRLGLSSILFEASVIVPLSPADTAQPATYPFLTHMYVNAISDDGAHTVCAWPFMIINEEGICCEDVFSAIHDNQSKPIQEEVFSTWPWDCQERTLNAMRQRQLAEDAEDDAWVVRRADYFGSQVMFRGLAPNPNKEGWILFVRTT